MYVLFHVNDWCCSLSLVAYNRLFLLSANNFFLSVLDLHVFCKCEVERNPVNMNDLCITVYDVCMFVI